MTEEERKAKDAEYARQRRAARRAAGLCTQCGRPSPGKARCPVCVAQERENRRYKAARGICTRCGAETLPGRWYCPECSLERSDWQRDHRDTEKEAARGQQRREQLKAAGRCSRCGRPVEPGRVNCKICNAHNVQQRREAHPPKNFRACGTCLRCGRPRVEGYYYCPEHLQRARETAAKAREARRKP